MTSSGFSLAYPERNVHPRLELSSIVTICKKLAAVIHYMVIIAIIISIFMAGALIYSIDFIVKNYKYYQLPNYSLVIYKNDNLKHSKIKYTDAVREKTVQENTVTDRQVIRPKQALDTPKQAPVDETILDVNYLSSLSIRQLKAMAKEKKLSKYSSLRKEELIMLIYTSQKHK